MTRYRVPPPPEAACLYRPYSSSQKGGTLIAAEVADPEEHVRRLASGDGYRPSCCPGCGHGRLHVHDYRTRMWPLLGPVLTVLRFRCVGCKARWQVLPAFLARHLWYGWPVIEEACEAAEQGGRPRLKASASASAWPSARTVRRWLGRLASSGRRLVQVLASSAEATMVQVAQGLGLVVSRGDVVDALGLPLSAVAALLHRLVPGVRLM